LGGSFSDVATNFFIGGNRPIEKFFNWLKLPELI